MLNEINLTALDHPQLKQSLVEFLQSTGNYGDFNFEGSGINTLIDLLVRNSQFDAFLAHMLANESFIQSAQIRGNVSAHAQKNSYLPKSCSASKAIVNIIVTPNDTAGLSQSITVSKGKTFVAQYAGNTYEFVCPEAITLYLNESNQYVANNITLYQGQLITNTFIHVAGTSITIPNQNIDMNTLKVTVNESGVDTSYTKATSIKSIVSTDFNYFPFEDSNGNYGFDFGRDILGHEPLTDSVVTCEYVNCEDEHANGATNFISASSFNGYANVQVTTVQQAIGGQDKEDIESIRFAAPRAYQTQERALSIPDYENLIKESGYSVKSVKCWSGNGTVYFTAILENGLFLTRSIRDGIINYVSDYYVGSVDLRYKEPSQLNLDLVIQFRVDKTKTSKTRQDLFEEIDLIVTEYDNQVLNNFGQYFNDSELISRIKQVKGVESVNINANMIKTIKVNRSSGASYVVEFGNPIKPHSIYMDNFYVNAFATGTYMYDDGEGKLWIQYTVNGNTIGREVGTVDYLTGKLVFSLDMLQPADQVDVEAEPQQENIYVTNNQYLTIRTVDQAEL